MTNDIPELPNLLDTGNGYTVCFRGRYLYSRYNPSKNAVQLATGILLLPGSLVVCPSPLLGYGLGELIAALPDGCHILALETNSQLFRFSRDNDRLNLFSHPAVTYVCAQNPQSIVQLVCTLPGHPFKRTIRLDLSGGSSLDQDTYDSLFFLIQDSVSRVWKNQITLIKIGRLFARNIFRNMGRLDSAIPLSRLKTRKAICIAGAGPSLDSSLEWIAEHREKLFVLAVDTAALTLASAGITSDAVVLVESQYWIEWAFHNSCTRGIPLIADISSRPQAITASGSPVSFFMTRYATASFLERLQDCIRIRGEPLPVFDPAGSVGLTALSLAAYVSQPDAPFVTCGLDFSWKNGYSHSKDSSPVRFRIRTSNRLHPLSTPAGTVTGQTKRVASKNGEQVFSDAGLLSYAEQCAYLVRSLDRIILDIGATGVDNGIPAATLREAERLISSWNPRLQSTRPEGIAPGEAGSGERGELDAIQHFLQAEEGSLRALRGLLTGEIRCENRDEAIRAGLEGKEYLYLHFPDALRGIRLDGDFLKRIRIEIEFFLKSIRIARTV